VLDRPIARLDLPERQQSSFVRHRRAQQRAAKLGRTEAIGDGGSPTAMLAAMDVEGIDVAVVFRTIAAHVIAFDDLPPPLAAAICRAYNAWLREYCDADGARLRLAALLSLHDVELAVAEARRAVRDLGAVALVLPSNPVKGRPWYDHDYDPLWAAAQELHVPVTFHGIQIANQEHLGNRYLSNLALMHAVGHPVELQLCLGAMLLGGVFERFPRLRAGFLEGCCSWAPFWLSCLDEHWEKFGDEERFGLKLLPSEYFQRQCYLSVDPDESLVVDTVRAIGDDNIVISTDWPHDDSAYPRALSTFLAIDGLSDESRRKILWDNCARLYNLPTPTLA
jgi:predicted TIM-barrel fold metal-dependent hydrolase